MKRKLRFIKRKKQNISKLKDDADSKIADVKLI
jgi:hypothetical protein